MKKFIYYFISAIILMAPFSCKDDDPAPANTLVSSPEAQAAYDNQSGGVYKGALIGSSGVVKVVLQGGVKEIHITLDGVKKVLTTTELGDWESGEEILHALFSNGDWSVLLYISEDGAIVNLLYEVAGHDDLQGVVMKETSTSLIKSFEGTYTGSSAGTWNFIVQGQYMSGLSVDSGGSVSSYFGGAVINNVITVIGQEVEASGTLTPGNPDTVSGTWNGGQGSNSSGTWTGTRTL